MPNSKNSSSDPKNSVDSKNNNADQKDNNADLTNSNSTSRKENTDSKTNADASPPQGDGGGNLPPPSQSLERQSSRTGNKNASTEKGGEANLTLGGIDLNSSGSVVVKADKKLITVLFPDGRDGRSFTLKVPVSVYHTTLTKLNKDIAETSDDLYEWKTALEEALENAPTTASTGMGQTGSSKCEKARDRSSPKSLVLGRPVLLALEDIDGTPSFLEKALRYVEEHGIKVEGILRQAADVELVERRIREYEQGVYLWILMCTQT
ncbi:hypothetical protein L1987_79614 [Smallanthus sonchifolius]|uniref:Uncharacterized protein n=1 Tax=Smallanthus sonchifolius TaxID=185202 RepID=A0ACB8YPK4_9ASTR|nr:hypothetical protein L1987_79614 [Smallanthus sonchifolius]